MPTSCAQASTQLVGRCLQNCPRHVTAECREPLHLDLLYLYCYKSHCHFISSPPSAITSVNNRPAFVSCSITHTRAMRIKHFPDCFIFTIQLPVSALLPPIFFSPLCQTQISFFIFFLRCDCNKQTLIQRSKTLNENTIKEVGASSLISPRSDLFPSFSPPSSPLSSPPPSPPSRPPLFAAGWLSANWARQD